MMFLKYFSCFFVLCSFHSIAEAQLHADCITPNNETATCESIYECKVYLDTIKSATASQKKYMKESLCGHLKSVPVVCCGTRSDYKPGSRQRRENRYEMNPAIPNSSCGLSKNDDGLVGGNKVLNGQFPWSARLQYNQSDIFKCEGTLINARYVLTAGLCLEEKTLKRTGNLQKIRLGQHNCEETNQDCKDNHLDVGVEEIILNPNYGYLGKINHDDIGLIRLDREVPLSDAISPICLPQPGDIPPKTGDLVTETGWYKNNESKLKSELQMVSPEDCYRIYNKTRIALSKNHICAGGENNMCAGISGGSLMRKIEDKWYLEGIISFGPAKCVANGHPNVYTSTPPYLGWIHSSVKV